MSKLKVNDVYIEIIENEFYYYFDKNRNTSRNGNGEIKHITIMECLKEDIEDESINYEQYQEVVLVLLKGGHV